ncbi:hypothetical protein [Micromonospora sp. NPDC048830]|uniref:hypothetical protein n=1 Tax=Micromonospora sp. NPDC048830 TaxID=3364257 RepID=UPI0037209411
MAKTRTPVQGTGVTRSDFDGDDVAASGDPFNYSLPHTPSGVVAVRYSSAPHNDYLIGQSAVPSTAERDDWFGNSVAILNPNGTGPLDAVVAAFGEEVTGDTAGDPSGAITRFHGSTGGLVPQSTMWTGLALRTDRIWPQSYGLNIAGPQSTY